MDLKELLGEELYGQVQSKIGDKKLILNDGNFIPRDKFNSLNEELKGLKAELTNRDTQLNDLKVKAAGNDELTKKIEELNNLNSQTKTEYETKIKDMQLSKAIESALTKNNAKFSDLLTSKIDKSKLIIDGDNVLGLDDQINGLKTNYKELFGQKLAGNEPNMGGNAGGDNQNFDSKLGLDISFLDKF